jgi:hypothetical protein
VLNPAVEARLDSLHEHYTHANPFPHVVIDDFFAADYADSLLADFPAFEKGNALTEMGKLGKKSVNRDIEAISDSYRQLAEWLVSSRFIDMMQRITGIDNLIAIPGGAGGTHESRSGADLAPHLDYNYVDYEGEALHRRLNVLFYLNKDWDPSWGGNFEVHSDPQHPSKNEFQKFGPNFNRVIVMETSERSWHGYDPIRLPNPDTQSRKSISIYLFSRTRPEEQIAPRHSTFYAMRPLPEQIQVGRTLSQEDVQAIQTGIAKRDRWIMHYQREVLRFSAKAEKQEKKAAWLQAQRLKQQEVSKGFWGRLSYVLKGTKQPESH